MTSTLPDRQSDDAGLVAVLRSTEAFCRLSDDQLRDLAARMAIVSFAAGDVFTSTDNSSACLYVVISGEVGVTIVDRRGAIRALDHAGPGSVFGEMNVLSMSSVPATLHAHSAARLATLSKEQFCGFIDDHPSGALEVIESMRPRLRQHRLWTALHISEMFGTVEPSVLAELESEFELIALYGGEVLFRQGDPGDSLYVVVSGRLRVVSRDATGHETVLAELGTGETVGEMGVISGESRSATVYATRDSQLARLSKASVMRVVDRHPQPMMTMLTSRLVSRLRSQNMATNLRRRSAIGTIALVPAGPHVDLAIFSARLSDALSKLGSTVHLASSVVDRRLGRDGASQAHDREGGSTGLLEWLAELEVEHRYVVYQADRQLSPWTERCIRQADRIVLVGDASGDPSPGEIETELMAGDRVRRAPVTLALVHPPRAAAPTGTARWLAGRTLARHLHVRSDVPEDYGRVSRFLTGTAVGITLGGGFARGLAHLGVLRAMQELNVPVDAIGGASMGAMIGAQCVMGLERARIAHLMRSEFAASFDDMTLPFLSLKRGGKASRFVRKLFDDIRIEDLWLPYFCVSANLNRAELKVHTSGRLADAVMASSRAPGIFPPMVMDGELHVDGGLINNVPVDIMKSFVDDGLVIGVDVSPPHELNQVADYGDDVPGWRAIWHRFNPTRDRRIYRPSILLVLMRVIEFGGISYRREKAAIADVYISPDVLKFKRNDFHAADDIADAGYRASRESLAQWLTTAPESLRLLRPDLFRQAADS